MLYTTLAFGVAGTVGSVASIGMQLSKSGIQFAEKDTSGWIKPWKGVGESTTTTKSAGGFFRGIWSKIHSFEYQ